MKTKIRYISWDLETFLINEVYPAPYFFQNIAPIPVCLTYQEPKQEAVITNSFENMKELITHWLESDNVVMVGQNLAFDLYVAHVHFDIPIERIFKKYNKKLVKDTMIRETLLALATGEAVRNPGKQYSLAAHVKKYLKKDISENKGEDAWRMRYSELYEVPLEDWPDEAVEYPLDDARLTLKVFAHQHKERKYFQANEDAQTRAAFDLHLISARCPYVDADKVEVFVAEHSAEVAKAQAPLIERKVLKSNPNRFKDFPKGDPRREGYSMDTKLLKRLVQADYTQQGRVVPATPKGDISLAGDTLLGCKTPVLRRYGEAATSVKMMEAFAPGLRRALQSPTKQVTTRYGVLMRTGRTSCVHAETPIKTDSGYKPISEVTCADKVWTHKQRWQQVDGTRISEKQQMITLDFSTGTQLTCTKYHRLLNSQGQWVTVESMLNEHFEKVDSQDYEPSRCISTVQTDRPVTGSAGDCYGAGNDGAQRDGSSPDSLYTGGAEDAEVSKASSNQTGNTQPDVGKEARSAPELQRRLRYGLWVPKSDTQRQEASVPQSDNGSSSGTGRAAEGVARTPHRRRQEEQRSEQSGSGHTDGTSSNSFFTGEGLPSSRCTGAYISGVFEVYDIGVAHDHSYLAGGVFNHNSSKINLQQLPKAPGARECFIPAEGKVFVSIDYDSMEMRAAAQTLHDLYGIRVMLDTLNSGKDPHLTVGASLRGITYAEADELKNAKEAEMLDYRALAKIFNFGALGGIGAATMLSNMSVEQIRTLQGLYPGRDIQTVMKEMLRQWKEQWELQAHFNRMGRLCDGGKKPTYTCPKTGRIKAMNTFCQYANAHFQPIAADALKESLRIIQESCWIPGGFLYEKGVSCNIEIHDEVVMSGPVEGLENWVTVVQDMMTEGAEKVLTACKVPTDAEVCGIRWRKKGVSVEKYLEKGEECFAA